MGITDYELELFPFGPYLSVYPHTFGRFWPTAPRSHRECQSNAGNVLRRIQQSAIDDVNIFVLRNEPPNAILFGPAALAGQAIKAFASY
jgi:hypothetical protein